MVKKLGTLEEMPNSNEMMSLHEADGKGMKHWYLDGWICYGSTKKYVQRVPCEVLSIGGYEDTEWHTVGSATWVQSWVSQRSDIWYCLKQASRNYRPYHDAFLWIADFAKHLVDYLHSHEKISLQHFKDDFDFWIRKIHGSDDTFQQWLRTYSDTDFRRVLVVHACFLYNQATQLGEEYADHPLWAEVDPTALDAIQRQGEQLSQDVKSRTVVTPYVYECFKHLPWAKFLEVQQPRPAVLLQRQKQHSNVDIRATIVTDNFPKDSQNNEITVSVGDVVAVNSDTDTDWKSKDSIWYGYVQEVRQHKQGKRLSLLWLYRPSDTPCQDMQYPLANELFLSDHCNCGDKAIYAQEVVSKLRVAFYENTITTPDVEYFVRQKYNGSDGAWTTLDQSDFKCICKQLKPKQQYNIGDTWLGVVKTSTSRSLLEPVEIVGDCSKNSSVMIKVRKLNRLGRDYQVDIADPNELVYTSSIMVMSPTELARPCYVRFYTTVQRDKRQIPAPYCRKGTADFYFISHYDDGMLKPLLKFFPTSLNQGFDPTASPQPSMKGLDIFCGGGTFGRGLEDGGAVEMEWAVDYFREAIHTYRANVQHSGNLRLFFGSVNDYLSQAMRGKRGKFNAIAQRGEVEVIAAGSPCQGFSMINPTKSSDASLINISMIASVISFIDFYRPKYALLENVLGMAKRGAENQKQNVFAQTICALVGMGYQVRPFLLDAWNFGAPQSRTRLFISIAAPGLAPLSDPPQSHSHPSIVNARALGKTANGLPSGTRYWESTPFKYVTIREATRDLPLNNHAKLTCIQHPDHRLSLPMRPLDQGRIECIPKYPNGMNFVKAVKMGVMPEPQIGSHDWGNLIRSAEKSKAWKRVVPDALIPTITTRCTPQDGIAGQWIHWEADRPITIMEARRAQGFPDYEVIVGSPSYQWKIVGNSVARPVALALGISLRNAWLANAKDEGPTASAENPIIIDEAKALVAEEITNEVDSDGTSATSSTPESEPRSAELTAQKGLTRTEIAAHHQIKTSNLSHRLKSRVLPPAASPASTFTKRLRSSLASEEFLALPKKRQGPRTQPGQPLPMRLSNNIDSAIDISSDDDSPSDDALNSTAYTDHTDTGGMKIDTEASADTEKKNEVWSTSRLAALLKSREDARKNLAHRGDTSF